MGVLVAYGSCVLYENTLYSYLVARGTLLRPSGRDCLFMCVCFTTIIRVRSMPNPSPRSIAGLAREGTVHLLPLHTVHHSTVTYVRLLVRRGWLSSKNALLCLTRRSLAGYPRVSIFVRVGLYGTLAWGWRGEGGGGH